MRPFYHWITAAVLLIATLPVSSRTGKSSAPVVNAPTLNSSNALALSGSAPSGIINNSYVEVPYAADLNTTGMSITIEAWVKRSDASRCETLVGNGHLTSYWLGFCTARLRFYSHGTGTSVDSNASVPAGVWTHVAVTYDGVTRRYYINGVLDTNSIAGGGALVGRTDGKSLGIGYDMIDSFSQNYFMGLIQDVRIWNVVRTAQQIRDSMYQSFSGPQPGLLAEWRFNGTLNDSAGGHNGIPHDSALYSTDGAIPHDIRIPQVNVTPTLDGYCDTTNEYANAMQVIVGGASAFLLHTSGKFWVCLSNLTTPTSGHDNWAAVYLDPNYTRLDPAQPDHLSLEVHTTGVITRTRQGTASGQYIATTAFDGRWNGAFSNCCGEFPTRSAEFEIDSSMVGGWSHVIGLALAQHWLTGVGDDRLWPAQAVWNLPSTWSSATLGGTGAPRTFTGRVVYQPRDASAAPVGVPGVGIDLIGSDPNGGEALAALAKSSLDGSFSITSDDDFTNHRLELDPSSLPKGYLPHASAPAAHSIDPRTLDYGGAGSGTYAGNTFTLADARPYAFDPYNGSYFLIVAPQSIIDSHALTAFVEFKQRLGFQVEVISTQKINSTVSGADLSTKIRNLEISRRSTYGNRFRYVLLVGPNSVIPVRFFNLRAKSTSDCQAHPGIPSDWYYSDLVSNWDSNGNGCLADGIWSDKSKRAAGYTPDSGISFQPTVAFGRLPYTTASAVRTALSNSMTFEQQADSFKRKTVLAASMMDYKGRCWSTAVNPSGTYTNDYQQCDHISATGTDGSYLAESMLNGFLNTGQYSSTPLYENEHPATGSSPAHLISPQPVTEPDVTSDLNGSAYGMVNLTGHGNAQGVYRLHWATDANSNGIPENPAAPPSNAYEIQWRNLLTNNGLSGVNSRNGNGAIFITASCSTGEYNDPNSFGAQLLSQGHGVAWVGGLSTVIYFIGWKFPNNGSAGGMMDMDYYVTQQLLGSNLRLGDAFWRSLGRLITNGNQNASAIVYDLYGDPTLSYWGNPGEDSTLAAWPMLRQNAFGAGYVTLPGPGVPKQLWSYAATPPGTATLQPSPVVSNNGEVIVAHGPYLDVLRSGSLYQRLALDAPAFGTPAIAADGTIYATDVNGKLYAFAYSHFFICFGFYCNPGKWTPPDRYRRWTVNLGNSPLTSPVIGSDGMIAVGRVGLNLFGLTFSYVDLVRPDGHLFRQELIQGNSIGALAVGADKVMYAATNDGTLARIDFFCSLGACLNQDGPGTPYSTPPLLAYGYVYAGRSNGVLVKKSRSLATLASFTADSAITAGPVAGPGGQILIGTHNGTLYSLTSNLALRWKRAVGAALTGVPAFSEDALYIASGNNLHAYNPFSGAPLWTRSMGAGTGSGSVSVGYGREVYLQAGNGTVEAFGEGWVDSPWWVVATPTVVLQRNTAIHINRVEWSLNPPPPPNPTASGSASRPDAALASPTGYLLQRSSDNTNWEDLAVVPPGSSLDSTLVFSDTNVTPGVSYLYRVQSLGAGGNNSDWTSSLNEVNTPPVLPQSPLLDSVTPNSADSLQLAWHSPAGDEVNSYLIERSLSAGGPFTPTAFTTGETRVFTDTGLAANTTYFYRLNAFNDTGQSVLPSNVLSAKTHQISLPTPQNVHAALLSDGRVQISWDPGPAGVSTVVEVNPQGFSGFTSLGTAGATGPFTYDPAEADNFGYRIKFVQGDSESAYALADTRLSTYGFANLWLVHLYLPAIK
jgi:Peptidase family C25/Concanavalin A-like lectin/glucanases superfamily/PQQ-like domain